jgi:uridine kinase
VAYPTARVSAGAPTLIAIDGLDGSGKSQLAERLVAACAAAALPATLIHVDDFRRALSFDGLEANAEADLYYGRYYDLAALDQRLRGLLAGADTRVLVVEGVFLLRVPVVAERAVVVALEIGAEEARRRIVARDRAKGRSDEEITRRIERRYFPGNARYRAEHDVPARAALVIANDDWSQPRVVRRDAGRLGAVESELTAILEALFRG